MKEETYREITREISALLEGETNAVARMASIAAVLHARFDTFLWTGFYTVDESRAELVVGPYQGMSACLRIPFGKGVCGRAAQSRCTQVVADVHSFPGHIACDVRSQSEIVVPVFCAREKLIAVLDIDSASLSAFDAVDARCLEAIIDLVFSKPGSTEQERLAAQFS